MAPVREFIFPTSSGTFSDGSPACVFRIQSIEGNAILGDTFLRSAYVVYDLSNKVIGLAQTVFDTTDSNIVPFASISAQIPGATAAPSSEVVQQAGATASVIEAAQLVAASGFYVFSTSTSETLAAVSTLTTRTATANVDTNTESVGTSTPTASSASTGVSLSKPSDTVQKSAGSALVAAATWTAIVGRLIVLGYTMSGIIVIFF